MRGEILRMVFLRRMEDGIDETRPDIRLRLRGDGATEDSMNQSDTCEGT